jgi:hypothetical protein
VQTKKHTNRRAIVGVRKAQLAMDIHAKLSQRPTWAHSYRHGDRPHLEAGGAPLPCLGLVGELC